MKQILFEGVGVMYLLPTVISSLAAAYFYVPDFLDIPLGMMTFRGIVSELVFLGCCAVALAGLARSVEKDPVWPWNRRFKLLMSRLFGRP